MRPEYTALLRTHSGGKEVKRRRPHWEREDLLQVFLMGAFLANPKLMDGVEPKQFTGAWAEGVAFLKKAVKDKDSESLYRWLSNNLGVNPTNGTKAMDAALERLRQDSVFRDASKVDEYGAQLARLMAEMRDRRQKLNAEPGARD